MNILWIPHNPSSAGIHRRDQYFIDQLKNRHTIYTLSWETAQNGLQAFWKGLQFYPLEIGDTPAYHTRRIPDVLRRFRRDGTKALPLNQRFFTADIRKIVRRAQIDVVITGPSCYDTGYPPFDLEIPILFDYLDCADWDEGTDQKHPEQVYLERSDGALCVSALALERAKRYTDHHLLLPNGVAVERFAEASGEMVRTRHGLEGAKVLSLIGLTCSRRLYFIDAVRLAKQVLPDLKCLLVGHDPQIEAALDALPDAEDTFVYTGPRPHSEMPAYFAASDVGMYPVDESTYFHGASPIKIFEYTAAGKPVVVPRIREAERMGFSNLVYASPTVSDFASGIIEAFDTDVEPVPEIHQYDWKHLADSLDTFVTGCTEERTPLTPVH